MNKGYVKSNLKGISEYWDTFFSNSFLYFKLFYINIFLSIFIKKNFLQCQWMVNKNISNLIKKKKMYIIGDLWVFKLKTNLVIIINKVILNLKTNKKKKQPTIFINYKYYINAL